MNYYISDLHLFHKNVTRAGKDFDDRPFDNLEEMHSIVKDKWNAKVTNGDTVYILGDLAISTINKVKRQLNRKLKIEGIVMTMVDFRTVYARDIFEKIHLL